MLGIGVMLGQMTSNKEAVDCIQAVIGKQIKSIELIEDEIVLKTSDGGLKLLDYGQLCCESRYMRTDDDLSEFVGAVVNGFELKQAPDQEDEYGVHEVQFLEIATSKGAITFASHNEHNGYYGGFHIVAKPL